MDELDAHLVGPGFFEAEFISRCGDAGLDPDVLRAEWEAGELDPDAGYDPANKYFGQDIAGLTMLLPLP
jgi:hypothetical protein